jgi:hypothetical protein
MEKQGRLLNQIILSLVIITVGSLLVSASGVLVESVIPAYFWYLAVAGMLVLSVLWLVMAVMLVGKLWARWYHRKHPHHHGGMPGLWT